MTSGRVAATSMGKNAVQFVENGPTLRYTCCKSTCFSGLCRNRSGVIKSFQIARVSSIATVDTIGFKRGKIIFQKQRNIPLPSISAASSSSAGTVLIKPFIRKMERGRLMQNTSTRITPRWRFIRLIPEMILYRGIMEVWKGMISPTINTEYIKRNIRRLPLATT